MGPITTAVTNAAKKVYYVLRNKSFGYVALPQYRVSFAYCPPKNPMTFNRSRATATRFDNIDDLLAQYGAHGVNNGTYSSNLEIVRVEETPGTPSRRVATCSETPTGYVIQDGSSYLVRPEADLFDGWGLKLSEAKVFDTESDAIYALTARSKRVDVSYHANILRVINVPATPVITETVLS